MKLNYYELKVLLSADENRNLPPYHLDATTGEEAYVFDELCPERFWPHLKIETWIQNQNLPPNTNKIEFLREVIIISSIKELIS